MKQFLLFFSIIFSTLLPAQTELVFVFFKDKPNKAAFYSNPGSELSQKALDRRKNLGIALNDQDAPVENSYIQNLRNLGFDVKDTSKWLNGAAVYADLKQIELLKIQPFVSRVESFVKNRTAKLSTEKIKKFQDFDTSRLSTVYNYGEADQQISQINLKPLHEQDFTGKGITVGVIDTGYPTVDNGSVFAKIRNSSQIKGGYNFISKNTDIYNAAFNPHGTLILGAISGYIENSFVGTSPDADFYLYVTEDTSAEYPMEEIYWIEAAEEADRKGVDIITSSLGYYVFDDARYNYTYAEMNGSRTFIARGAQIATEKGIFVLVANGNEADIPWKYLISPADNANVFSIGAVDAQGNPSVFSSFGPNSNGVVKPDVSAKGTGTATVIGNQITYTSGTSLSTPLVAGGVACLLQALPKKMKREDVRQLLRETASLYPENNPQTGYGIANFGKALQQAVFFYNQLPEGKNLRIFPNPVANTFYIQTSENIKFVELYDTSGRRIKNLNTNSIQSLEGISKGLYILKINTDKGSYSEKIIKK